MTMEIDPDDIAAGNLSYKEAKYLQDRGRLPEGYEMPESDVEGEDDEDAGFERQRPSRITPLEEQKSPTISNQGGIQEEEGEEDYIEGWNNDQRRAELSKRNLSVMGNKEDLISRLRRNDLDESTDDDLSEVG